MNSKNIFLVFSSALIGALFALILNNYFNTLPLKSADSQNYKTEFKTVNYSPHSQPVNFTAASSISTPAVVHINTSYVVSNQISRDFYGDDLFQYFFGNPYKNQLREAKGSGSGVIISSDGYIVTNNHVVENANEIKISMSNDQSYVAEVVGTDKDTDLALLKIEEKDLPFLNFANSDSVLVGEWVLAVGNPFNLSSTVTAGIVSAKGRNINLLQHLNGHTNTAIESFIQTDAAVNPGNSGGALVNTQGELIGINTAIATPTGTFAGYSFAIPANIVAKVINDLKKFGVVKRAYLGVSIQNIDEATKQKLGLKNTAGVLLENVFEGGAADEAGLQNNDIIIGMDGSSIKNVADLHEKISSYSPGDVIELSYLRNQVGYKTTIWLKNVFKDKEQVLNNNG